MDSGVKIEIGEAEVDELITAIYDASGYDFSNYSMPSLHRRLQRYVELKRIPDLRNFIHQLENNSILVNEFIEEITVNVTEMFRDPYFFSVVINEVLPELQRLSSIKIWHAGCSTGEEAYSMAIALKEFGILDKAIIYATDINQSVLHVASSGTYSLDLLKLYEANYKAAELKENFTDYYDVVEGNMIIKEVLRRKIIYSTHNLVTDSGFNKFDFIVCRNVMIYFNKELQEKVLQMFNNSLNIDGFLALGSRETIQFTSVANNMSTYNSSGRIWRKMQ